MYGRGGRKFGFLNLGPLGCLPVIRILGPDHEGINGGCFEEEASTLAKLHNEALSKMLSELENQLKDFSYALYDFHTNMRERMDHPSKYGTSSLLEILRFCCCDLKRWINLLVILAQDQNTFLSLFSRTTKRTTQLELGLS